MATPEQLRTLLEEGRNGCDHYIRHPLARRFIYTDGVQEMVNLCGAFWLLDIVGTEAVPALLKAHAETYVNVGLIEMSVLSDGKCKVWITTDDDTPPIWFRNLDTDFPPGAWVFKLGLNEDEDGAWCGVMCLLSED